MVRCNINTTTDEMVPHHRVVTRQAQRRAALLNIGNGERRINDLSGMTRDRRAEFKGFTASPIGVRAADAMTTGPGSMLGPG